MRDRLSNLAGGLLALAILVLLLNPGGQPPQDISLPHSKDRGGHGLAGLAAWLAHSKVPVYSLRRRYDTLADPSRLPATGNLLISHLPHGRSALASELDSLKGWLSRGNQALLLVAAADSPAWYWQAEQSWGWVLEPLGLRLDVSGYGDETDAADEDTVAGADTRGPLQAPDHEVVTFTPTAALPEVMDVNQVVSRQDRQITQWNLHGTESGPALRLALLAYDGRPVLWSLPMGRGRVWLSAHSDLLGNALLDRADNARLLGNLLNLGLGPGGHVILDDFHWGLSDLYDPAAFFGDPRLHNTLWFLLGLWVIYLVGRSQRLAPLDQRPEPPRGLDLVVASGGLYARRLPPAQVAGGLLRDYFDELRRHHRLPCNGRPPWPLLERHAGVGPDRLRRLKTHLARLEQGHRPDLVALSRLLHELREETL